MCVYVCVFVCVCVCICVFVMLDLLDIVSVLRENTGQQLWPSISTVFERCVESIESPKSPSSTDENQSPTSDSYAYYRFAVVMCKEHHVFVPECATHGLLLTECDRIPHGKCAECSFSTSAIVSHKKCDMCKNNNVSAFPHSIVTTCVLFAYDMLCVCMCLRMPVYVCLQMLCDRTPNPNLFFLISFSLSNTDDHRSAMVRNVCS